MISILAQERVLGFALGSILMSGVILEERKNIYRLISTSNQSHYSQSSQFQRFEPIFGKKSRSEFSHLWNKAVDQTLGPVIAALSSRGW
ncbi:zinc finger, C3HC4 type family protein [Thalictrum thalictroides]|uniref:Zinc finger, C3HC4 type family protein n=1 Tax=Thalictrum thalictroides TaxID=46969 RepID=A0A7J6WZ01_THATH|nr:zinc finger, C3HC4 type family protein [Thalictrum thalictroides]